jgi:hypothetical protein
LIIAGLFWGTRGVLVVLGVGTVVGVVLATIVYRDRVSDWARVVGRWLVGLVRAIEHLAIGLADWLGWLADRGLDALRVLAAKLRGLPRSVGGLLRVLGGWLASVPVRAGRLVRSGLAMVATWAVALGAALRTPRGLAALAISVVLVAAGYLIFDKAGALAVFGAICVLVGLWRLAQRAAGHGADAADGDPTSMGDRSGPGAAGNAGTDEPQISLRALYRTFARWVVPGRWQRQTPGDVARAAVDRGFPEEPVARLTQAFREVEYGQRPESGDRLDRAQTAFEALRDARRDEERGEP